MKPQAILSSPPTPDRFSALEDEPWIEAKLDHVSRIADTGFSALEDEPWIEAFHMLRWAISIKIVSVLLKTSRGLKLVLECSLSFGWNQFQCS